MKKLKLFLILISVSPSYISYGQTQENSSKPKIIAVVNSAKWCGVFKANTERFGALLSSYTSKGVAIYLNDLSNETTKEASSQELKRVNVYEATNTLPRKGMGKALKSCGMLKDKVQTEDVAGIVTFIDPITHKQLKQFSIAESDGKAIKIIDYLLK